MTDTSPAAAARLRDLLMSKSGEERMLMGFAMFDEARALALAGLRAQFPDADEGELRRRLFLRFYENDFAPETLRKIVARIFEAPQQ